MPRLVILFVLLGTVLCGQTPTPASYTLSFSLQPGYRRVSLWSVTGCVPKAIGISKIKQAAVEKGLNPWSHDIAQGALQKRTFIGWFVTIITDGAALGTGAVSLNWVAASVAIKTAVTAGAGTLAVISPIIKGSAPVLDSLADKDLAPDSSGCGETRFYAAPQKVLKSFTATIQQ